MEDDEIDLKELLKLFWNKKLLILVIVLISVIVGLVYTKFLEKPKYTASTTLILAQKNSSSDENSAAVTATDVTLNDKLIETYKVIAQSNAVVRSVINNLNLKNISEDQIKNEINVTAINDTQVLKVSVTDASAENAVKIANELANVFSDKIAEIYKIDNINIVDHAELETVTNSINHKKDVLIAVAIGIVIAVIVVLIGNLFDTTAKSSSDIEKEVGIQVLAEVPLWDFSNKVNG